MKTLSISEIDSVKGAVSSDAAYGAAVGVGVGLLGIALAISASVWGTALLLGGSIGASGLAIRQVMMQ